MSAERAPWLLLSLGDPAGIGPEVLLKAARRWLDAERPAGLALTAPLALVQAQCRQLGLDLPLLEAHTLPTEAPRALLVLGWEAGPGGPAEAPAWSATAEPERCASRAGGLASWASLARAASLVLEQPERRALVTAPVNKHSLKLADFRWPGHTEYLGWLCGVADPLMWLTSPRLSVGLVSNHDPVAGLAAAVTPERVAAKISLALDYVGRRFPGEELVVLGLNPHAGDGGTLGREEVEWLGPLVAGLRARGLPVRGPLPADGALARGQGRFLAMYHDQGLPVFKLVAGAEGVNATLGLPLIRTSPDHGTAFDLAGQGRADEGSQLSALEEALLLLNGDAPC
ncbi:MAG: 4-hydroxythreonine-4-phosphate dehydrogenase PdxA [Candidatus Delongbacteria bacterium]